MLILKGEDFSENKRKVLENNAIQSLINKNIKLIEIEKYQSLAFDPNDLDQEILKYSQTLNLDVETFKSIFIANGIDFEDIIKNIKIELLWNSLIFKIYSDRLSINLDEIDDQLKLYQSKEIYEYLVSEIIIEKVEKINLNSKIDEVINRIKNEGFEQVAIDLSITETSALGGDLGWIVETEISDDFKFKIINTKLGDISDPIILPEGILIFKVRDKRVIEKITDLEEVKNQIVNAEKTKILRMHSLSHYENLRRSVTINYYE
jgi:peptidyl-prolyl cis-trans isomerase SurA